MSTLLTDIRRSATTLASTREQIAAANEKVRERRLLAAKQERARRRVERAYKNGRMRQALRGVSNILALWSTEEMQTLLALRNLSLYTAGETFMASNLYLSLDGLRLECLIYGIVWGNNEVILGRGVLDTKDSVRIAFGTSDDLLNARKLEPVYSAHNPPVLYDPPTPMNEVEDEEFEEAENEYELTRNAALKDAHPLDCMFQVLVDCADQQKLEAHIRPHLVF